MNRLHILLIAVVVGLVSPLLAQPLADRVPEDAIVYLGWCGTDSMPPEYKDSHLKAVLDASNLRAVFSDFVPRLVARAGAQNREVGQGLDLATGLAGTLARHPTAIYFSGLEMDQPRPMPRIGIVCQAGAEAQALVQRLTTIKELSRGDAPIAWAVDNDYVTILIGITEPGSIGKGLAGSTGFKSALAKVKPNGAVAFYIDFDKALALADEGFARIEDPKVQMYWPKIREASGLTGLHRLIWTSGFDGKEWMDQAFIDAPAPRKGLLTLCDAPRVPEEMLKGVPASSTYMSAGAFDLGAFIENVRTMVGEVEPEAKVKLDQGLGFLTMMLGRNFQRDIVDPLGPHWLVYVDPNTAGIGFGGLVIVNRPDDAKKAEQGINSMVMAITNMSAAAMKQTGLMIPLHQTKTGEVTVNYIATPLISPAWATRDGNLYMALYPQVAATAVRFSGSGKPSILENPEFVALRKRLGAPSTKSICYIDLRRSAQEGYQSILMISRLAMGFADMWGVKSPELVMPTLEDLTAHLSPMGSVSWSDDSGIYMKSITPFPGAEIMSGSAGAIAPLIGSSAMMGGIMAPAMARARESAERVQSQKNLRQIGMAAIMYANDNNGQLPASLDDLGKYGLNATVLDSPVGDAAGGDFVFLGNAELRLPRLKNVPQLALAYDAAALQRGQGTNVLFLDGHVEWVSADRFEEILTRAREAGLTGGQ